RADAERQVAHLGGGKAADQHRRSAGAQDRSADVRDLHRTRRGGQRALMEVGQAGGGRHGGALLRIDQLILTSVPRTVSMPVEVTSAAALPAAENFAFALWATCRPSIEAFALADSVRLAPACTDTLPLAVSFRFDALSSAMPPFDSETLLPLPS